MGDRRTKTVPPEIQELLDQGLFAAAVRDGSDILSELDYGSVELAQECLEGLTVYCSEFTGFVKKRIAPSVELRGQQSDSNQFQTGGEAEPRASGPLRS